MAKSTNVFFDDIAFDNEMLDDESDYYSTATEDNKYLCVEENELGYAVKDAIEEYREENIENIF